MRIETLDGWRNSKHDRMKVAAAIIGGVASVGSAIAGGISSSNAANAQESAANHAADLQQQQFQQTQQNQQPFMDAGKTALSTIGQDQANQTGFAAPFNFQADPGYQFQLQQGQNAINSSAAATGGVLNGGTLKALDQYTTGLANTTYGDAYNRYLAGSQQQYNQLFSQAQLGENATATTGQQGANAANAAGNYLTQAGNAQAAGDVGIGNAVSTGLTGAGDLAYGAYKSSHSGYAPMSLQSSPLSTTTIPTVPTPTYNWGGY